MRKFQIIDIKLNFDVTLLIIVYKINFSSNIDSVNHNSDQQMTVIFY